MALEKAMKSLEFEGQAFVVLGGAGGIGTAVVRSLVDQGARVMIAGRDATRLETVAQPLGAVWQVTEATDAASVDACFQRAVDEFGKIDGAVNCVGSILLKPAHLTTDGEWSSTVATNLNSSFYVLRAAVRFLMKSGGGSIVLSSSVAAGRGLINHEAIAASKAGVEGLTLSAAATYARQKVRVNAVAPGLTRTPLTQPLTNNEVVAKASAALHPLGRIGEPEDVASAITWLLSPRQSWITGQVIGVDGGMGRVQARG